MTFARGMIFTKKKRYSGFYIIFARGKILLVRKGGYRYTFILQRAQYSHGEYSNIQNSFASETIFALKEKNSYEGNRRKIVSK